MVHAVAPDPSQTRLGWLNAPGPVSSPSPSLVSRCRSGRSHLASVGIFLPVYLFKIIPAPWFKRHRDNPQLKAFVDGATAAATGAITGAVLVLGARAITDLPTAAIALVSLAVRWRFKVSEPVLVVAACSRGISRPGALAVTAAG